MTNPELTRVPVLSNDHQTVWTDGNLLYVLTPGRYTEPSRHDDLPLTPTYRLYITDPEMPRCTRGSRGLSQVFHAYVANGREVSCGCVIFNSDTRFPSQDHYQRALAHPFTLFALGVL